jgi:hypothetical protein
MRSECMDSLKIERTALSCVRNFFNHSNILDDYISENDKEPFWDGNIMIKSENGITSKVPTQVKGKTIKKMSKMPTYPVNIKNLRNYRDNGGIAYFVVYIINTDKCYFYYALLTPLKIQWLIETANGNWQKSIKLKPVDVNNISDFETEFKAFDINRKRQTPYAGLKPMSLEDALKKGHKINIPLVNVSSEEKAIEYIINNPTCLYAEIDSGDYKSLYPIGYDSFKLVPIQKIQEPVSVDDVVYFDRYTKQYKKDSVTYCIGECMDFTIQNQEGKLNGTVNFHRSSKRVSQIVNELKFIQSVTLLRYFRIDNMILKVNCNDPKTNSLNKEVNYWLRIEQLFKRLHISLDLDISEFSNKDFKNLELLMIGILDKKEISQSNEINLITTTDVGDYTILLYAEKQESGNYLIDDFFVGAQKLAFAYKNDNKEQKLATSMFSLVINHANFASFINVDYSLLVSTYDEMKEYNPFLTDRANDDMLVLLNTYDKQVDKKSEMLNAAYEINDWIIKTNDKNHVLNIVNKLQIVKRKRALSGEEMDVLLGLSEDRELDNYMKIAIQLLLGIQKSAEHYFKRLNEKEQKFFESLPIYIFWKDKN